MASDYFKFTDGNQEYLVNTDQIVMLRKEDQTYSVRLVNVEYPIYISKSMYDDLARRLRFVSIINVGL